MARSVITLKDGSKRIFSDKTERVPDEGQFRPTKYAGHGPGDVVVWRDEAVVKRFPLGAVAHLTLMPSETPLAVDVTCVTKDRDGVITGIGGVGPVGRKRWYLFTQTAIDGLGAKWHFHTTSAEGMPVTVMAVLETSGAAHLRTVGDDDREDDLGHLELCPAKYRKEIPPTASTR